MRMWMHMYIYIVMWHYDVPLDLERALVGEIVEEIARLLRRLALLFTAKDEVNPLVQVRAHVIALQRRAQLRHIV